MASFATDSDLLSLEPEVFVELPFGAQRRLVVTDGELTGARLTSVTGGLDVLAVGSVVVVIARVSGAVTRSVVAVMDGNTAVLSEGCPGLATTGLRVECRTFEPQIAGVHEELMIALGIEKDDTEGALDESAIVSVTLMRRLEALGALARAYAAAAPAGSRSPGIEAKAEGYRRRFQSAVNGARVLMDIDGDGRADVWRCPGIGRLVRA